ncbi:MAG: conjugal transfer protein TraG N-terminal domain-containing protein [Gammaproteobacteria bacterium]|nr:conjugal transfer protein TraG N-terminal domain-containing protein [Gammaproteobacteria bacterium]
MTAARSTRRCRTSSLAARATWADRRLAGLFPAMDVVRRALPMVLTMLKMAFVICIPLVLLIGTYDLKTVVTVSASSSRCSSWTSGSQLARWIDSTILDALYGWGFGADRPHRTSDPRDRPGTTPFGDMLPNFVMAMMFIVAGRFGAAALKKLGAGVRTGNIVQGLSTATSDAKGAGGRGAGMAMSAVSKK